MPLTCTRCGAQNPDGNAYCQTCGTPLSGRPLTTAPPPPPPPPGAYASPPPLAAGYQSPYYVPTPGGMQPPMHRTPWMLIIAAVVALILIMTGAGTAISIIGARSNGPGTNGLSDQLPTPSPASTPTPIGSPTPAGSGSGPSNDGLSMPLPPGWSVETNNPDTITLSDPDGYGIVTAKSGPSSPAATAQENKAELDTWFAKNYPDAKACPNTTTTNGTFNGAPGVFWVLCFTLTSGGQAFPAAADLFAGANTDGSVYYVVMLVSSPDNLRAFESEARPVLTGIQWKLK